MASLTKTASKRAGKGIVKESLNRGGGVHILEWPIYNIYY